MNRKFTNLVFCLVFLAATLSFNQAKAVTYYWTGKSSTNWTTASNWSTSSTGSTTAVTYPGLVAGDIAILGYSGNVYSSFSTTITINLTSNLLLLSQLVVPDNHYVTLNLKSSTAFTLAIPSGILLGDASQVTGQLSDLILSSTGTATCSMSVSGASYIGATSVLQDNSVPITYNGPASSTSLTMAGTGSTSYALVQNYTTITAVCTFNLNNYSQIQNYGTFTSNSGAVFNITGNGSSIYNNFYSPINNTNNIGIFNANGTAFNLSGSSPEIHNQSGTFNLNSGSTVSMAGTTPEIYCNADYGVSTFTATSAAITGSSASSLIYNNASNYAANFNLSASTLTLSGTSAELENYSTSAAAAFNSSASSTINLTGSSTLIYNDAYGSTATFDAVATTINLGTTSANGASSSIQNTDQGVFLLDAGSIINTYGATTKVNNTYTTVGGTKYYGMFYCSPSSIINLLNTGSILNNDGPNNCFTLLSDNTGAATIGALTGSASITGTYDVQRYMTGGTNSYRNYRLLSSPVNKKQAVSSSANNIDLSYLGATATPYYTGFGLSTYYGAFIAGPGSGFGTTPLHTSTNPIIYLYQESILPGTTYNAAFTSGKNVGLNSINTSSPYNVTTISTAAAGKTTSDNSSGVSIPAGNGYLLYYLGNNQRTNTTNTVLPTASTITASGYINQGSVPVYMWGLTPTTALTYTTSAGSRYAGMTMLGNPYPSTIDLHIFYNENSSVLTGMFYELNNQTQQFPTYNGMSNTVSASPTGGSQYVASGQGFYAVLSKAGTLTFNEDQKAASSTAPIFPAQSLAINPKPAQTVNSIITKNIATDALVNKATADVIVPTAKKLVAPIILAKNNSTPTSTTAIDNAPAPETVKSSTTAMPAPITSANVMSSVTTLSTSSTPPVNPAGLHLKLALDSDVYDEIGVYFNKAWSDNYDKYDSFDLDGLAPKVYLSSFTADGVRVSINAMSDYKHGKKVKLYVRGTADGTYALNLEDIANIDTANYNVFLIDNKLGDTVSLVNKKPYSFALSAADTAAFSNRFVLDIASKPLPPYRLLAFAGQKVSSGVQLNWKTVNESNYTGFLVQKQENNTFVTIDSLTSDSAASYNFVDQHPALGNNVYRLEQIISPDSVVAYSSLVTIGYNTTAPNGGGSLSIYPNPSKAIINISMAASTTNVPTYVQDIYNTSGVLVAHQTVSAATWTQDVSAYRLGIYVVQLKDTNGNIVGQSKFIKVN